MVISMSTVSILAWGLLCTFFCAGLISDLPRSSQGESVLTPWWVCVTGYLASLVIPPWIVFACLRPRRRIALVLLLMAIANAGVWMYLFNGLSFLNKAWRRGL